ncbi:hypothetical protein RSAG8_01404, partial [Rhizoctonia solani AG-8 WAC10335]
HHTPSTLAIRTPCDGVDLAHCYSLFNALFALVALYRPLHVRICYYICSYQSSNYTSFPE